MAGEDYVATTGVLTIPAGQTVAMISVEIFGDTDHEGDETFPLVLSGSRNASLADREGVGTLVGDDGQPIFEGGFESGDVSAWRVVARQSPEA